MTDETIHDTVYRAGYEKGVADERPVAFAKGYDAGHTAHVSIGADARAMGSNQDYRSECLCSSCMRERHERGLRREGYERARMLLLQETSKRNVLFFRAVADALPDWDGGAP